MDPRSTRSYRNLLHPIVAMLCARNVRAMISALASAAAAAAAVANMKQNIRSKTLGPRITIDGKIRRNHAQQLVLKTTPICTVYCTVRIPFVYAGLFLPRCSMQAVFPIAEVSVCLSVCHSVNCDKTNESSAEILIPHER